MTTVNVSTQMPKQVLFSQWKANTAQTDATSNIRRETQDGFSKSKVVTMEDFEVQREIQSKIKNLQDKINHGKKLNLEEKDYLCQNKPDLYAKMLQMDAKRTEFCGRLANFKESEGVPQMRQVSIAECFDTSQEAEKLELAVMRA